MRFVSYLQKDIFNEVLTMFFRQSGMINPGVTLDFDTIEFTKKDTIQLEANLIEETLQ